MMSWNAIEYKYVLSNGETVAIEFLKTSSINHVLCLYHGCRCIFAHGVATTTLEEGCLKGFPTKEEMRKGLSRTDVADEFMNLYD